MKKISILIMIAFISLSFITKHATAQSNDANSVAASSVVVAIPAETSGPDVTAMQLRLTEINAIDKSELTTPEKKDLQKEEREIRKQLKESDGGLYISGGAIILIVILLIIFW